MSATYYAQSEFRPATMTVGQLISKLQEVEDLDLPVVFRTPLYGTFGSNTAYSVDAVSTEHLPSRTQHYPAALQFDEETGEEYMSEPFDEVWRDWKGVVIA